MSCIGVAGFGRCGSTMLMTMLDAGGVPPVYGSAPGSYEIGDPEVLCAVPPGQLEGHAVKLLDLFRHDGLPVFSPWRFIWLDRNGAEQGRSVVKFMTWAGIPVGDELAPEFTAGFARDRPEVLGYLRSRGDVLVLEYERILVNPTKAAKQIARFVEMPFDVQAAAAVVHRRAPQCRPDMAVEEALNVA